MNSPRAPGWPLAPDELEAERDALRRLAGALLRDFQAAEDVVQDAFAAALSRDRRPLDLPRWLRAVVRNLALDRRRRAGRARARERQAARREAVDPESETLARLELVECLAREVRALPEPYSTTVRLRYFDGLSPRQIAARLAVPTATVESRLARAHGRLREQLDRAGGSGRWLSAVAGWVHPEHIPSKEIFWMSTASKLGLTAAALALAGWAWWTWRVEERNADSLAVVPEAGLPRPGAEAPLENLPSENSGRTPAFGRPEVAGPRAEPAEPPLEGLVVDESGQTVAEVEIGAQPDGETRLLDAPRATSGPDGRFSLAAISGSGHLRAAGPTWFTLGPAPYGARALPSERVVCIAPREALAGIVVDGEGLPLPGVRVEIVSFGGSLQVPGHAVEDSAFARAALTDEQGRYRIEDAPRSRNPGVQVSRVGYAEREYLELAAVRAAGGRIVFDPFDPGGTGQDRPALVLRGRVLDQDGRPLAGAFVDVAPARPASRLERMRFGVVRTDAAGAFAVGIQTKDSAVILSASAPGLRTVVLEPTGDPRQAESWPTPLVLHLRQRAPALSGRVVDQHGAPLPHAWVDLLNPTPWGITRRSEAALDPFAEYNWEALAAGRGVGEHVNVDDQGRFRISELSTRSYRVVAFDRASLGWASPQQVTIQEEAPNEVLITIDTSAGRNVFGRVVDSTGAPVAGARVALSVDIAEFRSPEGSLWNVVGTSLERISDAEGRFEFRNVTPEAHRVEALPPSARWFRGYTFLGGEGSVEDAVVVVAGVCFARIELSEHALEAGATPTDVVAIDGRGLAVDGAPPGLDLRASFQGGRRTGVFAVPDTAKILAVRQLGTVLLEIPVELRAGQLNVIRH